MPSQCCDCSHLRFTFPSHSTSPFTNLACFFPPWHKLKIMHYVIFVLRLNIHRAAWTEPRIIEGLTDVFAAEWTVDIGYALQNPSCEEVCFSSLLGSVPSVLVIGEPLPGPVIKVTWLIIFPSVLWLPECQGNTFYVQCDGDSFQYVAIIIQPSLPT